MEKKRTDACYLNRAVPVRTDTDQPFFQDLTDCVDRPDSLAFLFRDQHHTFQVGLKTIVSCLEIAQAEQVVPRLPTDWWIEILNME